MHLKQIGNVCSCYQIEGFGGLQTTIYGDEYGTPSQLFGAESELDKLKSELLSMFAEFDKNMSKKYTGWESPWAAYVPKMGILCAVTTDLQSKAEANLAALGFTPFGPVPKLKHPESKVTMWNIEADTLCRNIGYVSKFDTRTQEERGY